MHIFSGLPAEIKLFLRKWEKYVNGHVGKWCAVPLNGTSKMNLRARLMRQVILLKFEECQKEKLQRKQSYR